MTTDLVTLPAFATVLDAASEMRDRGVGDVVIVDDGRPLGLLTDRDIAVRVVAAGRNPALTPVTDVCSREEIATVSPDDRPGHAGGGSHARASGPAAARHAGRPARRHRVAR